MRRYCPYRLRLEVTPATLPDCGTSSIFIHFANKSLLFLLQEQCFAGLNNTVTTPIQMRKHKAFHIALMDAKFHVTLKRKINWLKKENRWKRRINLDAK